MADLGDLERMLCSRWEDPPKVEGITPGVDRILAGIRQECTPWFGTFADVDDASRLLAANDQVDRYLAARKRRRQPNAPLDAA